MFRKSRPALRVAVLAGGESAERKISLASGRCVATALQRAGHLVSCFDPREELDLVRTARISPGPAANATAEFRPARLVDIDWQHFDACYLALHGGAGEDGRVQQFFQQRGFPFTGSDAHSARLAMSKRASKEQFRVAGVPTPDYEVFWAETPLRELTDRCSRLGFPVVTKPDSQGSSLGVSLANNADELAAASRECLRYDRCGLVEQYIAGREFTVAVVDRKPLPAVEVVVAEPIFSFAAKYDATANHCPENSSLSKKHAKAIAAVAVEAAKVLDSRGLVRVDIRLDTAGQPWVLELNSTPGMTEASLAPIAARRAGLDMPAFCDQLLRQCVEQGNRR